MYEVCHAVETADASQHYIPNASVVKVSTSRAKVLLIEGSSN